MPPSVNWLVPQVQLTGNNVVLTINVGSFSFGNWAEVSGYIIQDDVIGDGATRQPGAIIPFSAIQVVPYPATGSSSITVNIATQGLDPGRDVRVITRVAEVQIWPTGLQLDPQGGPLVSPQVSQQAAPRGARWVARAGNPGVGSRVSYQPGGQTGTETTDPPPAIVELSGQSISLKDLEPGKRYRITIQAVDS